MNEPCPCPNPISLYFRLKPINCLRRDSFGCKSIPSCNFASCKSRKTSPVHVNYAIGKICAIFVFSFTIVLSFVHRQYEAYIGLLNMLV